jgi:hypothetical protein
LPLLVPLGPLATLLERFVPALGRLLSAQSAIPAFVGAEANRSHAQWPSIRLSSRVGKEARQPSGLGVPSLLVRCQTRDSSVVICEDLGRALV